MRTGEAFGLIEAGDERGCPDRADVWQSLDRCTLLSLAVAASMASSTHVIWRLSCRIIASRGPTSLSSRQGARS